MNGNNQEQLASHEKAANQEGNIAWSENQVYQLRQQIEAYKHLNANGISGNGHLPKSFDQLQLLTDPEEWAQRQAAVQQQAMQVYEEHFENNMIMYGHDLWEYIERRLANEDGATVIVHPADEK